MSGAHYATGALNHHQCVCVGSISRGRWVLFGVFEGAIENLDGILSNSRSPYRAAELVDGFDMRERHIVHVSFVEQHRREMLD